MLSRVYIGKNKADENPVSVFIGNLPTGRSEREYEAALMRRLGQATRWTSIEAIYYEHGAVVLSFPDATSALAAVKLLRDAPVSLQMMSTDSSSQQTESQSSAAEKAHMHNTLVIGGDNVNVEKRLVCMCLPQIKAMKPELGIPVLVLVNARSGGCQGVELLRSLRLLLNPFQVFSLEQAGPLPALHSFRELPNYRILCCGGDGTVGWVLSCLDNVSQDSACTSPPVAIMPIGTGNDLSRVLNWGPGFAGTESLNDYLEDVALGDPCNFDRWTVSMAPSESTVQPTSPRLPATVMTKQSAEDNSSVLLMNNYFGIGIDAEVALDFHKAREEQPDKFKSRNYCKKVYLHMGLRKMFGRNDSTDLHRKIKIDIDDKPLELPPLEGIIVLNIMSWGSGCDTWGSEKSNPFAKPAHDDGLLEVVGVGGMVHLGQIQSGMRSAIRLAQGEHIHIQLLQDLHVQIDGEPWLQPAGHINVRRSALRVINYYWKRKEKFEKEKKIRFVGGWGRNGREG